jgi:hypothetical protein
MALQRSTQQRSRQKSVEIRKALPPSMLEILAFALTGNTIRHVFQ